MTDDSDRTFLHGNRNPYKYGFSLRASSGDVPDPAAIAHAASLLGREPFLKDEKGFECEIIAAAVHPDERRIVYVQSRAKQKRRVVDISIKIHFVDVAGKSSSVEIQSYNPFFGCDVGLLQWIDAEVALLIYTEKHWTFVYRIGDCWPPKYAKIDERWSITDRVLSFMAYKADVVQRLEIPSLKKLSEISVTTATEAGTLPPDPYRTEE